MPDEAAVKNPRKSRKGVSRARRRELSDWFYGDPRIETYLLIRKQFPKESFDLKFCDEIMHAIRRKEELGRFGISEDLFIGALDNEAKEVSLLSTILLKNMQKIDECKKSGITHTNSVGGIIPNHLSDWLIANMLHTLSEDRSRSINLDFLALLLFRIKRDDSRQDMALRKIGNREWATQIAGYYLACDVQPSYRIVASLMGVHPSTVKRWFKSVDDFNQAARSSEKYFRENPAAMEEFYDGFAEGVAST